MAFEPSGHRDLCIYDVVDAFCGQNSMDPLLSRALAPSDPTSSKDASVARGFEAEVYVLRPYVMGFTEVQSVSWLQLEGQSEPKKMFGMGQ